MNELEAERALKELWGLEGKVEKLAGERDLNFKISGDSNYVLKFYPNANESATYLNLQDRALDQLSHLNLSPKPVESKNKRLTETWNSGLVRLLQWIDGEMWAQAETHATEEIIELGRVIARIDLGLKDLNLTSDESTTLSRDFIWNMLQADKSLVWAEKIKDEALKFEVIKVLERYADEVKPKLLVLPSQLIHNDANEWNIVLSSSTPKLIDFGDLILAPKIVGLAVAGAYLAFDSADPTFEISKLVRGYHSVSPLTDTEISLLHDLVKTRIAMSIANAALQTSQDPDNKYLDISQGKTPKALDNLNKTDINHVYFRYRNAIGLEANPNAKTVRRYLSLKTNIADVVSPPFKDAKKVWIDWSIDNPNLPRTTEAVAEILKENRADVGIGRYCENREVYQGEAFSIANPNARTFHLGVDLWMYAGAPVFAPLDGIVELFNDNNTYLDYGPVVIIRHETDSGIPFWTLYGHLSRESLANWQIGKKFKAGELLGWMGKEDENVGWPPHVHFQLLTDLCGMGLDVHGVAPKEEVSLWRGISLNPNLILRIPEGTDAHSRLTSSAVMGERRSVLSQNLSLNFKKPLHIVSGDGAYLIDDSGRKYLDLVNNVAHVGHSNPRVNDAASRQMQQLNTNTRYLHQGVLEYARSLTSTLPDPLSVVFFVNSGSEANDLAIRLARTYTKRRGVLALRHAYHGHTQSVVEISPYKFLGKGGDGCPAHVAVAELPDLYRGSFTDKEGRSKYIKNAVESLEKLAEPISAFFAESIVSTGGQIVLPPGYLPEVYKSVRAKGGICVSDEVQIGLGRVGDAFWGFELQGVIPDIVTMGKPLGNGHPLAAVVTTPEIAAEFNNGMEYFNTFGGNPVSAAIGQSVFDTVMDQALQLNAKITGDYLQSAVRDLAKEYEIIGDVRGHGLFIGVELVKSNLQPATEEVAELMEFALQRGVLLSCDGPDNNVLKIKPPMIIGKAEVDIFINVFKDWLEND